MKTRKVVDDGRKWLSPWHFLVFAFGAVVGSILSGFYGAAYTSAAVIVTCWFMALMLVAFDRSRIRAPHAGIPGRRGESPMRSAGSAGIKPTQVVNRRGAGVALSLDAARRARLHTIAGGKGEPPSRAS